MLSKMSKAMKKFLKKTFKKNGGASSLDEVLKKEQEKLDEMILEQYKLTQKVNFSGPVTTANTQPQSNMNLYPNPIYTTTYTTSGVTVYQEKLEEEPKAVVEKPVEVKVEVDWDKIISSPK